jgi:hypothetical protein
MTDDPAKRRSPLLALTLTRCAHLAANATAVPAAQRRVVYKLLNPVIRYFGVT